MRVRVGRGGGGNGRGEREEGAPFLLREGQVFSSDLFSNEIIFASSFASAFRAARSSGTELGPCLRQEWPARALAGVARMPLGR